MTMITVFSGKFGERGGKQVPLTIMVHPFLAGARKTPLSIPDKAATRKTGVVRDVRRCIAPGADRPVPKFFGAKEQARAARIRGEVA